MGTLSGTSMAGPHVVGVVALLWSARPQLERDIAATKTVLQNTANPAVIVNPAQTCGGIPNTTIPNNSFGYGRVDALAAVNSVPQGTPTPTPTASPSPTTDRDGNSDANGNTHGNAHGYCDGHSYSYSNAQTDANTQVGAIGKAASHASAETIAAFAKAKIVAIGDR